MDPVINALKSDAIIAFKNPFQDIKELKKLLEDVEDYFISPTYTSLDPADQIELYELRDNLKERINNLENMTAASPPPQPPKASERPEEAEALMNKAETAFYANRFLEAVDLYDKVLDLVPDWQRAIDHRIDAERYLREGPPTDALPEEAGHYYGMAQAAVRVKNYASSRKYLELAMEVVKAAGIMKWNEGRKFEEKLEMFEDAEKTYQEGLAAARTGDLELAIDKAETAFAATSDNKYRNEADKWRTLQADMINIHQALASGSLTSREIQISTEKVDYYQLIYGPIPFLLQAQEKIKTYEYINTENTRLRREIRKLIDKPDKLLHIIGILSGVLGALLVLVGTLLAILGKIPAAIIASLSSAAPWTILVLFYFRSEKLREARISMLKSLPYGQESEAEMIST